MSINHPWLFKHPIKSNTKYLIIGTHPPMPYCGKLKFYYGNMSEFWKFLDKVYRGNKLYLNGCPRKSDIIKFLDKGYFAITDMVYITRVEKFSTDAQMGKIVSSDLNPSLKKWLNDSNVVAIYFTSFGGSNSAKHLFKKWYKENFKIESKTNKITSAHFNKIQLFGRKIKLIDLFSPSPTARRSSPRVAEYKEWKKKNRFKDYDDFRIFWYKKYLPKL